MNTRPPFQHETLSDEERELARVVRALPGGEPPPALDALILKAATDAVASSHPQRKSLWGKGFLGTSALWIGTAAASVLTVGIGWQVFQSMRAPIYELPDGENVRSAQVLDRNDKDESLTVEVIPAREPKPTSPPPPEAFADAAADAASESDQLDNAPAEMPAVDKPRAVLAEKRELALRDRQEMAKASDDSERKKLNEDSEVGFAQQNAVAAAPPPPPPPAPPAAMAAGVASSGRKELASGAMAAAKTRQEVEEEASQPVQVTTRADWPYIPVSEDAKLPQAQWLDAIRERVRRDDIEGAKASLKRYRETHPKRRIPKDLLPLLK